MKLKNPFTMSIEEAYDTDGDEWSLYHDDGTPKSVLDLKQQLASATTPQFPIKVSNGTELLYRYQSQSRAGGWYYITRGKDGVVYCDCFTWKRAKKCDHLTDYFEQHKDYSIHLRQAEIDAIALEEFANEDDTVAPNASGVFPLSGDVAIQQLKTQLAKTEGKLADVNKHLTEVRALWTPFRKLFEENVRLSRAEMQAADAKIRAIEEALK